MTPAVESTSVPTWAVRPTRCDADVSGRSWTVIEFGGGESIAAEWVEQITARHPGATPRVHLVSDDAAARRVLDADVSTALVGWRLMIAGPADACLRLRAHAIGAWLDDDEISVATTDVSYRDVHCGHCRAVTHEVVNLGGLIDCTGCGRLLAVQPHVSRRIGAHLGVMT